MWLMALLACGGSDVATPPETPADPPAAVAAVPSAPDADAAEAPVDSAGIRAEECDKVEGGAAPEGPDCLSGTLSCGDTIVGHTQGGVQLFDTKFYEKRYCTPATTNHDGGDERVYKLVLPDRDLEVDVYLDTPCADLDLAAMEWNGDECPNEGSHIRRCEMWPKDQNAREKVHLSSKGGSTWLIVVEGKDDEEGAFSLTVDCGE